MGIMNLAATSAPKTGAGSSPIFFIILLALFGGFYFLMIRPQRNRQRRAMQTQSQVTPGQRIRTTAGMYGRIVSGDDRDVVIEVAPGVHVTMLRRAIMDVLPEDDPGPATDEPEGEYGEPEDEYHSDFDHPFEHEEADQPNGSASSDDREIKDHNS